MKGCWTSATSPITELHEVAAGAELVMVADRGGGGGGDLAELLTVHDTRQWSPRAELLDVGRVAQEHDTRRRSARRGRRARAGAPIAAATAVTSPSAELLDVPQVGARLGRSAGLVLPSSWWSSCAR